MFKLMVSIVVSVVLIVWCECWMWEGWLLWIG